MKRHEEEGKEKKERKKSYRSYLLGVLNSVSLVTFAYKKCIVPVGILSKRLLNSFNNTTFIPRANRGSAYDVDNRNPKLNCSIESNVWSNSRAFIKPCTDKGSMVQEQYCSEWSEFKYITPVRFPCFETRNMCNRSCFHR